jgi:ethanolamine utilization protein EutA (predicted chaperonin)
MKKAFAISVILTLFAGCNTDIVTTSQLKTIKNKCVCVTPIDSQDPYVGKVLRDVLEKEFIRKHIQLCDANTANVILTGSTFLTTRAHGEVGAFNNLLGGKSSSAQAIESVTIIAKDKAGNVLLTGSYNNVDQFTASKLAQEFGSTLADKLK